MRSGFVIICCEQLNLLVECCFVEDDHMIQALAPDGADHALNVRSLARRSRCGKNLLDAYVPHLSGEIVTKDSVPISQQIMSCRVPGERIAKLLSRPFRAGMSRDEEVPDGSPLMRQHQEHLQNLEADSRHGEEVGRH
jgi:hypothetical protein